MVVYCFDSFYRMLSNDYSHSIFQHKNFPHTASVVCELVLKCSKNMFFLSLEYHQNQIAHIFIYVCLLIPCYGTIYSLSLCGFIYILISTFIYSWNFIHIFVICKINEKHATPSAVSEAIAPVNCMDLIHKITRTP